MLFRAHRNCEKCDTVTQMQKNCGWMKNYADAKVYSDSLQFNKEMTDAASESQGTPLNNIAFIFNWWVETLRMRSLMGITKANFKRHHTLYQLAPYSGRFCLNLCFWCI